MYKRVLVPIDGSEPSNLGLREAIRLATDHSARMRLVHVVNELVTLPVSDAYMGADMIGMIREEGKKILARAVSLARKRGIEPESVLVESLGGRASDKIIAEARKWRADIIVLGTHGRRGLNRTLMGSDAEEIIRSTTVPVLLVRLRTAVKD